MAQIVLYQAIIMFLYILVGAACFKFDVLSQKTVTQISGLVLKIVNPAVIFLSYQRDFDTEFVKNLGRTFLLSIAAFAVTMAIAYLCIRHREGRETIIERFSCIYSNCGFMGIPLVKSMFGNDGVFYLTAFLTVFNALVWSHGIMQMSGEKSLQSLGKVLRSPAIIAIALGMVCFFLQIRLPAILSEALEGIGNLNTPLAMLVAGATMIQTDLLHVFQKPAIYYICFLKLLVMPLSIILLCFLFPFDKTVEMTVVAAIAAPSAAMCTMQCLHYHKNAAYASEIFGVTTLFSIVTMPLMMICYEFFNI